MGQENKKIDLAIQGQRHDSFNLTPMSSSRNLENLRQKALDFLNIRDPGQYLDEKFPGSRILKNPNSLKRSRRVYKFRDDAFFCAGMSRCIATLTFTIALLLSSSLYAQENPALVVDLINRVGAVEAENRELRGQLEEARHEITQLTQRMDTLSADIDYRLNNPDSGAHLPSNASAALPLHPPAPVPSSSAPIPLTGAAPASPSSATEEYEKARALLEQGDYAAAEHAFAAFIAAHAKDDLAGAAQYWLGVTFFVRGDHEKAASAFAKGYKNYPKSSKAPDNLLKLAKSLAALDRKADACTALDQLTSEHPKAHVSEISNERKKLGCK